MIELITNIVILLVGFYMIIKSADYFVDEASILGKGFGMGKLLIGLTIVAVGTSLPELFTSIGAFLFTPNYPDFIIGTIMGSNITNIMLVFGVFLVAAGSFTVKKRETFNILFNIYVTLALITFVLLGFVNYFAVILLLSYGVYVFYAAKYEKKRVLEEEEEFVEKKIKSMPKSFFILFLTIVGLFIGARFVVTSIENLGTFFGIPTAYLSLTTIALASSLPELAVTINTAQKKEFMIGIGNVLGSNIINIAVVFGLSGVFGYYLVDTSLYLVSIIFLIMATTIFSYAVLRKKFSNVYGILLLLLYAIYLGTFFVG